MFGLLFGFSFGVGGLPTALTVKTSDKDCKRPVPSHPLIDGGGPAVG
jgi:hypothetical protein